MKSVLIISVVTFFLIFGGLAVLSNRLGGTSGGGTPSLAPQAEIDTQAAMKSLDAEKNLIRREKEELMTMRQAVTVQEKVLAQGRRELAAMISELEGQQHVLDAERERSAMKLAKMYENMKPAQAAPIISALEMDIVLDIMTRMKEREAARILAQMDAGLAARISTELSLGGAG